ncbi:NAD-dependent epimerase/dehydratase family protein [Marinicella gelatinilytica]|uniref:NAD-dependent epimerase/dehydratase family protein n=1 Tax=Marinicella gelatinilytica TaxID=2996017 RepID=UPI0022610124|nr:NAD-dependent epimerase/dehydratase family protein [Marinicella gelatinilytica]MCX7545417.1 NAD-dependent epimerase/dehydratase family protein [Marinicella gelatinilytica]
MDTNHPQKAFVTGATGFLGRHLCRELTHQGWQVVALCRSLPENPLPEVNYVKGNILSLASLTEVIPKDIDVLFHTAADTGTWSKNNARQTLTNVTGTQHILQCLSDMKNTRLVHVSSVATYGINHRDMVTISEDTAAEGFVSDVNYVRSKAQAERLIAQHQKLDWVIVQPSHIIGPHDHHNWIRLFKMIINNNLPSIPRGAGSFADVRDVAKGCVLAATKGQCHNRYILAGHNLSFEAFIAHVAKTFGVNVDYKKKPQWLLKLAARIQSLMSYFSNQPPDLTPESLQLITHRYAADYSKAITELGYETTPLNASLADIKQDLQNREIL